MGEGIEVEEEAVVGDVLREVRCAGDQVWRLSEIKGKILDSDLCGLHPNVIGAHLLPHPLWFSCGSPSCFTTQDVC